MYDAYKKRGMVVVDAEIPPYSNETIDFFELRPNYFRVQNKGTTKIYCGVSKVPTEETYDFHCKGEAFTMYAEPHASGYLNIYNPSGSPVKVRVLGFAAPFDPLALAFSQIEIDFSDMQLETIGAISEFRAPLPAGDNVIGGVNVENMPTDYAKEAKQKDYTETLTELLSGLTSLYKQDYVDHVTVFNLSNASGDHVVSNGGNTLIHMLTNDGETDFNLVLDGQALTIKPGESITELKYKGAVKLNGDGYSARMLVSYP